MQPRRIKSYSCSQRQYSFLVTVFGNQSSTPLQYGKYNVLCVCIFSFKILELMFRYVFYWWLFNCYVTAQSARTLSFIPNKCRFPHVSLSFVVASGALEMWRSLNVDRNVRWLLRLGTSNTSLGTWFNSTSNWTVVPHIKRQNRCVILTKNKGILRKESNKKKNHRCVDLKQWDCHSYVERTGVRWVIVLRIEFL